MKRKDFMLIVVVGVFAAFISFFLSRTFISSPEERQQSVETAQPLPAAFERPSEDYFNAEAVNPTRTIEIGEDPNNEPFDTE